jgi:hypothetical protein
MGVLTGPFVRPSPVIFGPPIFQAKGGRWRDFNEIEVKLALKFSSGSSQLNRILIVHREVTPQGNRRTIRNFSTDGCF